MTDPGSTAAERQPNSNRVASSYSTGGGGVTFERRVAVRYLAAMLTGAARAEAEGWLVTTVAFQQGHVGPVDDLHVSLTRDGEESESLELWVAVRRSPTFVRSHADTKKLISTFVEALKTPMKPGVERRLILTVAGRQSSACELAKLANLARSRDAAAFAVEMAPDGRPKKELKNRYEHFRDLVAAALPSDGDAAATTWKLLQQLHVLMPHLEAPDEPDWRALSTELKDWARNQTEDGADVLRAKLESLAASYSPLAAVVRRKHLVRDAHAALRLDRHAEKAAWQELRRLDREARDRVRLICGEDEIHLPRGEAVAELASALDGSRVLIVTGNSGTGKSALLRAFVEQQEASEPDDFEAVVLNLRHLPRHPTELRSVLGAPLERVLTEMHAPGRLLVLDGADVQAETDETPLDSLARSALQAGVAVCIVVASDGLAAVDSVAANLGVNLAHHEVVGLTDEEIDCLAEQIPALQRLASYPHSRELLRVAALADLLARAGGDDLPLSESAAMDAIWAGLVRDRNRRVRGTPDARDNVLRQLARNALEPGRVEPEQPDAEAVDWLRRDGVLHSSESTWSTAPSLTHDILRTYAVAKVLGEDTEPVERLKRYNTPRWALPAMRLVVEKLLNSDDLAARWTLQKARRIFDELAASGAGPRWADIPLEVALGLPEARQLLLESWDEFIAEGGDGLKRILRVVNLRFRRSGILERLVAENLAALLLEHGWPGGANAGVIEFIEGWLLTLVVAQTPAGEGNRQRLLELILHRVSEDDRRKREFAEAEAASRASHLPRAAADAEARSAQLAALPSSGLGEEDEDFDVLAWDLPDELTSESTVRCLALLGPDMSSEGEAMLRRVADRAPQCLAPALESPQAGEALAQFSPKLLADLTAAYYIKRQFGRDSPGEDGIRRHHLQGFGPLPAYYRGPFLALLRSDFIGGVRCLNRMLDHAARAQMQILGRHDPAHAQDGPGLELNLTGSPGWYVGDKQTWLWYRVVATGPYPCMSALQALEVVIDELIKEERWTPDGLVPALLTDCNNLAMPALAYGMLVRHISPETAAIDPFLSEPWIWHLEFARVASEHPTLTATEAPATAPERRAWDPGRVAVTLALSADDNRSEELRAVGTRLVARALELWEDAAVVRRWAASLDRNSWFATQTDQGIVVQLRDDPEAAETLETDRVDYARFSESLRLRLRYVDRFDQLLRPPPLVLKELIADVAAARDLLTNPSAGGGHLLSQGPIATAAAALEGAYRDGLALPLDDLLWSTQVLIEIVPEHVGRTPDKAGYNQPYLHCAFLSAARGLPLLLTPAAAELRQALAASGAAPKDAVLTWLFTMSPIKVRIRASQALDGVWTSPCDGPHCHHRFAFDLVEKSVRHSSVRQSSWKAKDNRGSLSGPLPQALAAATAQEVVAPYLNPALRALGAEAPCSTCMHSEATELLAAVLLAHRRGIKLLEYGYHQSESDALFAARAALTVAACGNNDLLLEHARDLASDALHALQEFAQAIAAVAEERRGLADAARTVWPQMMSEILGLIARTRAPSERSSLDDGRHASRIRKAFDRVCRRSSRNTPSSGWRSRLQEYPYWYRQHSALAALLPRTTYEHWNGYRELTSEPICWPVPQQWQTEINAWIDASPGGHEAINAMVAMLRTQPIEEQASIGIKWVERIVAKNEEDSRTLLLPDWLRDVHAYCSDEELSVRQRIVDTLVVQGDTRVQDFVD